MSDTAAAAAVALHPDAAKAIDAHVADAPVDPDILCSSRRFEFRKPSECRDDVVHALYNDEATMLPHLPMLCPVTREALGKRRAAQRAAIAKGEWADSCFMDIVCSKSGELVGTAGFRSIQGHSSEKAVEPRTCEFAIVVRKSWQRRGVCAEALACNTRYAQEHLGGKRISASTTAANDTMCHFLKLAGMKPTGDTVTEHGLEWIMHDAKLDGARIYCLDSLAWPDGRNA